jgi:hypothetical protein
VNFSRVEWHHTISGSAYAKIPGLPEDNWVWSAQGVIDMHHPETWGYVQFSSAREAPVEFTADPTFPSRMLLHSIYYAQKKFREKEGSWASTLEQLGIDPDVSGAGGHVPSLTSTQDGFVVTIELPDSQVGKRRMHLRQDALLWIDQP